VARQTNIENLKTQDDIYSPLVQQTVLDFVRGGTPIPDVIDTIISIDAKRQAIQFGQYRRLKLESATQADWQDARQADGVPIFARRDKNAVKINHRSHTAFDRTIVSNKASYLVGDPIEIQSTDDFEDWKRTNNLDAMMLQLVQDAAGMGEAFALLYSPEGVDDALISREQPYYCVMLYNQDTGMAEYGMIYYPNLDETSSSEVDADELKSNTYTVFWFDSSTRQEYYGTQEALKAVGEPVPHLFAGVPLVEFRNNSERISDAEPVLNLMDLYDVMDSDFLSELSQLRLAYLVLKGMGMDFQRFASSTDTGNVPDWFRAEDTNMESIVELVTKTGVWMSDNPDAEVSFVDKAVNYEAVQYAKDDLKRRIFQMANSYDPVELQGVSGDVTAYQISQMLRPLEDSSAETVIHFTKAIKYIVALLDDFYSDRRMLEDDDVMVTFNRNVPRNIIQDLIDARAAGLMVSQEQIARLVPLDIDYEANVEQLAEEQERLFMSMDNVGEPQG
jgi:SPP1 family phage portal protein